MQLGSTGLPKGESMAPSPTSTESFIFSFSFLGRDVLVPTLQMRESALPQAAPAVCLTRGAVSGRMDFLNLSSCFLYPHLLFCFYLTTFSYFSQYGSSLGSPWTFPTPSCPLNTLTTHSCSILPLYPVLPHSLPAGIPPQAHPHKHHDFVHLFLCVWGTVCALHALALCWTGHQCCWL